MRPVRKGGPPRPKIQKTAEVGNQSMNNEAGASGSSDRTGNQSSDGIVASIKMKSEEVPSKLRTMSKIEDQPGLDGLEGLADALVPADTLPEEMWLKIFGMLNSVDMVSCFQTCSKWKNWLMQQRDLLPTLLFPEVASLIIRKLHKYDLYDSRLACKAWKEAIDSAYQADPSNLEFSYKYPVVGKLPRLMTRFDPAYYIRKFTEEMGSHPGNPFPGRSIKFHWWRAGALNADYWPSALQFLERFGCYLHFVEIDVTTGSSRIGRDMNGVDMEETFRNCLVSMPNLKRLEYCGEWNKYSDQHSKEVRTYFRENGLPQLPHLETLKIANVPKVMRVSILENCCVPHKIKRLKLCDKMEMEKLDKAVYTLLNLEELHATVRVRDLERFRNAPPPLKKVRLTVKAGRGDIDFERFFTSLEPFADSLEDVHVTEESGTLRSTSGSNFRIKLPKLKNLSMSWLNGPLDPLLELSALKYLLVEFDEVRDWEGSVVQVNGFHRRMGESNIWTLMPSLKTLIFTIISCEDRRYGIHFVRNSFGEIKNKYDRESDDDYSDF